MMNIIFLGCTKFSEEILNHLLSMESIQISAIFSIPKEFEISYSESKVTNSNYADLSRYACRTGADYFEINSIKGSRITDYKNEIASYNPDVILVMGWYYMVPSQIRNLAKYGAWGIHASLLPKYAGGAPLVWAIIEGESESGVTLFKLDNGVDDGDIIEQGKISIEPMDTIKQVYDKATALSKVILSKVLTADEVSFTPQDKNDIEVYPQRSPDDGEIDWTWPADRIHNFIRAQTRPYPGAWTIIKNKKVTIWDASIEDKSQ